MKFSNRNAHPGQGSQKTGSELLDATVKQIALLLDHYRRDAPFRAPETVPEHQARLLNQVWCVLTEAQEGINA